MQDAHRPAVLNDHPLASGESCADVTGQPAANLPPDVNLHVVEIVCGPATLAALQADSNYQVLWTDANATALTPDNEHGKMRSFLAKQKNTKGADVDAALDVAVKGRTRTQVEQGLTAWLRTRPRGA